MAKKPSLKIKYELLEEECKQLKLRNWALKTSLEKLLDERLPKQRRKNRIGQAKFTIGPMNIHKGIGKAIVSKLFHKNGKK